MCKEVLFLPTHLQILKILVFTMFWRKWCYNNSENY